MLDNSRLAIDLSQPFVVTLQEHCSRETCPEMKAGEWLYLCAAHATANEVCVDISSCCQSKRSLCLACRLNAALLTTSHILLMEQLPSSIRRGTFQAGESAFNAISYSGSRSLCPFQHQYPTHLSQAFQLNSSSFISHIRAW